MEGHEADIVHLAFAPGDELVSVSADGAFAVSDAASGAIKRRGSVGGALAQARLSPRGSSLFLFSNIEGKPSVFRVDVASAAVSAGPSVEGEIGAQSRVFALDEETGLYWFLEQPLVSQGVLEGLAYVDFARHSVTRNLFHGAPAHDLHKEWPLDVDPARRIGVRLDHGPLERKGAKRERVHVARFQLFELATLRPLRSLHAFGFFDDKLRPEEQAIAEADPESLEYAEARDCLLRFVTSARLVRGCDYLWYGARGGVVRRSTLDGATRSPLVKHGGQRSAAPTLDDVFSRSLESNYTLGVSDSGRYVGFGNPNDFFNAEAIGIDAAAGPVQLPARTTAI